MLDANMSENVIFSRALIGTSTSIKHCPVMRWEDGTKRIWYINYSADFSANHSCWNSWWLNKRRHQEEKVYFREISKKVIWAMLENNRLCDVFPKSKK